MKTSALEEYERLRQNSMFDNTEKTAISKYTTTFLLVNVRSLFKHAPDIVRGDNRLINNDILCFTVTQIQPHYSTSTIQSLFKYFVTYFNNNNNKFLGLAYGKHNNLKLIDRKDFSGLLVLNIVKSSYSKILLKLMILYKTNSQSLTLFSDYLPYIIEAKGPDIIAGDFNIDAYQESRLSHLLAGYSQFADSPTNIAGSTLDHVYVKKGLQENNNIKVSALNIYFSNHDTVRVQVSKKQIDFNIMK